MMNPQDDFSAGELDSEFVRSDNPLARAGCRQMINWRLLNSRKPTNRPGRRALYLEAGRVDQIKIPTGIVYDICFGADGKVRIRDATGAVVRTTASSFGWNAGTVDQITWTAVKSGVISTDIVICFNGMQPIVMTFDGVSAWSDAVLFAFELDGGGNELVPFFRIAPALITLTPSATVAAGAAVNFTASAPVFVAAHVGAQFRFAGSRFRVTGFVSSVLVNAIAIEAVPIVFTIGLAGLVTFYQVGQLVEGSNTNFTGIVTAINTGTGAVDVQSLFPQRTPAAGERLISVTADLGINTVTAIGPVPCTVWDEQIVSAARGWPSSCSTDQSRLIFTDLPSVSGAVLWGSTVGAYKFDIGAQPTDAMAEVIEGKPRVFHVVPTDGGELVFTDRELLYVPISETNPLKPGSVVFRHVSPEPCSRVRPVRTSDGVLYVNAGLNRVLAVVGAGLSYAIKPYDVSDLTENHTHLFANIRQIVVGTGDSQFAERYAYVLKFDGGIITGKYDKAKEAIGWIPWLGRGAVNAISAWQSRVLFTTTYTLGLAFPSMVEALDNTKYLDTAIPINAIPTQLTPPVGKGPLWWLPGLPVDLMDGLRPLGTYQTDGDGFIIPNTPGEDLTAVTIIAGTPWTPVIEPFMPNAPAGEDRQQRMRRRKIIRAGVTVKDSTGFVFCSRRIPLYNVDEDANLPPPLREDTYLFRPRGRTYNPRQALAKDVPGPLTIVEMGYEISV